MVEDILEKAQVDPQVFGLRPDYRALLLVVDGLTPDATDSDGALLHAAESAAAEMLADTRVEDLPHVAAWREAYRSFGAKPQRTRNSLEALTRRAAAGLPRVNRLTDVYNAVSVLHQVPIGGEDLARYVGGPRLVRASGEEPFDTVADGADVVEYPEPGEVVWCDDLGVTCRRWNWRQGRRTQLTPETTSALFILDALDPMTDDQLLAAGTDLADHLRPLGPAPRITRRLITPATTTATTAAAPSTSGPTHPEGA